MQYNYVYLNQLEIDALDEISFLHRCLYVFALKPYIDYSNGTVGIKRKISWQSVAESLYVRPRAGVKVERISKAQIRRAAEQLEKAGLIYNISQKYQLIFKLPLAMRDYYAQNKAVTKPIHLADRLDQRNNGASRELTDIAPVTKGNTPQNINNNILFNKKELAKNNTDIRETWFEQFWQAYPVKQSKHAAQTVFFNLVHDEATLEKVLDGIEKQKQAREKFEGQPSQDHFLPAWKYPATWLKQHCWLDDVKFTPVKTPRRKPTAKSPSRFPINMDFSQIDYGDSE